LNGGVRKALRIEVAASGQIKDDIRELEAGGLYGFGATADARRYLRPRIVEGLPEGFHLVWAIGCTLYELARLHRNPHRSRPAPTSIALTVADQHVQTGLMAKRAEPTGTASAPGGSPPYAAFAPADPGGRNHLAVRARSQAKPPQLLPLPDRDRYPLPDAQRLPDLGRLLRRRPIVKAGHPLVVAVLGDGGEGGQPGADRRPVASRPALDVHHPGPAVPRRVDAPARSLDAPGRQFVPTQRPVPGAQRRQEPELLRPVGLGLVTGGVGEADEACLACTVMATGIA
jgi:hypothetical protein